MKLWIVQVEDDLSPVQVGEEGLKSLDKHTNVPGRGRFTSKVGRVTAHTTLKEKVYAYACVSVCVYTCMCAVVGCERVCVCVCVCMCTCMCVCACDFSP